MSSISFVKQTNETPVSGVTVECETTVCPAPAESIPSTSLARIPAASAATAPPSFHDDGNISFDDIILDRINAVQRVGELSEVFSPGEIVLNKTAVVHVPDNKEKNIVGSGPLVFVPVGMKRLQYVEKVVGGGRGALVGSEQEVVAAGGVLNWSEWKASLTTPNKKKYFEKLATFLLLIERPISLLPDESHQVFGHEVDGRFFAVCLLSCKGTWFTGFAKPLMTQRRMGFLKAGYPTFSFGLTTESKAFANDDGGKNYAHVPVLVNGPRTTPALQEYIKTGLGFGN